MSVSLQSTVQTYDAATADTHLFTDWVGWWMRQLDPNQDWVREGKIISTRSWKTVLNDPNCGALLNTVVAEIIGTGLNFKSCYQGDQSPVSSDLELIVRTAIDAAVSGHSYGSRLDAGNVLSRVELETQILVSGFISGDGIAVRCWKDGRPAANGYATCWRVIDPARVCNPDNRADDGRFFQGFEIVDGQPVAIHVVSRPLPGSVAALKWDRVPFFAADGSRNVIHYAPDRTRAGAIRGVSKFAILLVMAKHLMMAFRAHVVGKGIQAMHPMALKVNNPKQAADAAKSQSASGAYTPLTEAAILYLSKDAEVVFPTISYSGDDFAKFVETCLRSFTASWGYPWQFVLHQLTDANLAAAQAALDQADKTTTIYQNAFIHQVSRHLDDSVIREASARGRIMVPSPLINDHDRLMMGTYTRPRRADANRQRTRQAAQLAIQMGVSPSTAFAEMGYDFDSEVVRYHQDLELLGRYGIALPAIVGAPISPTAPAVESSPADELVPGDSGEDATDPADQAEMDPPADGPTDTPAGTAS